MLNHTPQFCIRLADGASDLAAVQRLRYDVFVKELGANGASIDHAAQQETDRFDTFAKHLLLEDLHPDCPTRIVGAYRLLDMKGATQAGQFYSETEFDLTALRQTYSRVLELGRACLHKDYRGGVALHQMWSGVATYVLDNAYDVMIGVASFHSTNIEMLAQPLSYLHHTHMARSEIAPKAKTEHAENMNILPLDAVDRKLALRATPALIKAYLRMGGVVGHGAFVDHAFNTTDICMVLETSRLEGRARHFLTLGSDQ